MNKWLAISMLFLAGCVSMGKPMTNDQRVETGCASASAAIKVLSVAKKEDKLSDTQIARITEAAQVLAPVCLAQEVPELSDIKVALFDAAVKVLVEQADKEAK